MNYQKSPKKIPKWLEAFKTWWNERFFTALKASIRRILKLSGFGAAIIFFLYFLPMLLLFLVNKNSLELNKALVNLVVGAFLLFGISFIIIFLLGIFYVILGTKTDIFRKILNNIVAQYKGILRGCAIIALVLTALGFIPQFFSLLVNIDNPKFSIALANLILYGVITFISIIIGLIILLIIFAVTLTIWRKFNPRSIKDKKETTVKEILPPAKTPPTVTMPSSNFWANRRVLYMSISGISGLLYIMYYVGRAYYEGYFAALGIPKDFMSYQIYDYIYFGAQIDTILITVVFTAILLKLLTTWFYVSVQSRPYSKNAVIFINVYLVIYAVILLCCVFLQIFRPELIIQKPLIMGILMTCIILLTLLVMVLYFDEDSFSHIRNTKTLRGIFIATAIITLLFSPYMSGKAWGVLRGETIRINDFPQVELYTNKILDDSIQWASADNITFRSDQKLYLVMKTSEYEFIKSTDNTSSVYVFSVSDILSTKILNLGKTK